MQVLGDDTLRDIAKEIADKVRSNATIDWSIRESARAKMMVLVKRTLTKWGCPPDKQAKAIENCVETSGVDSTFETKKYSMGKILVLTCILIIHKNINNEKIIFIGDDCNEHWPCN